MKKLGEILEGLFDGGWDNEAEDYTKLAYYINTIKEADKKETPMRKIYRLKNPEFSIEDIWEIIEEKAIKQTRRKNIQPGKCYAELAKTGIYLLNCENIKNNMFKDAVGPGAKILRLNSSSKDIELDINKGNAEWGTKGDISSIRDTYEIPHEIFDIILR